MLARFSLSLISKAAAALVVAFSLNSTANAHEVWIEENSEGQLVIRFAEYGEDYEKSPGFLDSLSLPAAWSWGDNGKPTAFEVQKKADHFLLVGAKADKGIQAETSFAVMKRGEGPARKPYFYARWHHAAAGEAKPALIFDIVPGAVPGAVQVLFRGKPVPEAKITVVGPDHKEEEITTDKEGKATFTLGKPGNYLLHCAHQREETAGFSGGLAFEAVSHNCSLIWKQP